MALLSATMDADGNVLTLNFNHTLASRSVAANQLIITASPSSDGVWKNTAAGTIGGASLVVPMALTSGGGTGLTGTLTTTGGPTVTDTSANSLVPPTTPGIIISH